MKKKSLIIVPALALSSLAATTPSYANAELIAPPNQCLSISPSGGNYSTMGLWAYSKDETFAWIVCIIHDLSGTPIENITLESKVMEDCGLDSLDMFELWNNVCELFDISINCADFLWYSQIYTVNDIVEICYHFMHESGPYVG